MGKKVWVNAAFWNAREQTLTQGYNSFEIYIGQVSKTKISLFTVKSIHSWQTAFIHGVWSLQDHNHKAEQSMPYEGLILTMLLIWL